jgi:DnaJ-class molecular chaperone
MICRLCAGTGTIYESECNVCSGTGEVDISVECEEVNDE